MTFGPFTVGDRHAGPLTRGLTNNSAPTSFADPSPTTTQPETVDLAANTANVLVLNGGRRWLVLAPFGTNAANETFDFKVWGWSLCGTLWIPFLLSKLTATLGTDVGVAAATIINTEFFADTIVEASDPNAIAGTLFSGEGENVPMLVGIDTAGHQLLEVTFDIGTPTAADANVAWRLM